MGRSNHWACSELLVRLQVHEPQHLELLPALEEVRVEGLVFIGVLKTRQKHADIPDGIGGISLGDAQGQEVLIAVDLDAYPARSFFDDLCAVRELDLALTLVEAGVHARGVAELRPTQDDRVGELAVPS